MADLLETIRRAALQAVENSSPTEWIVGTVEGTEPLRIRVDQKLVLDEKILVLTRSVTDHTVIITEDGEDREITVKGALEAGETVMLIRKSGGQKFIIVDRVVI